ncbi:DUF4163 domain-containing protein [Sphingomonas alba]|uniref:DUF4163 domain-containing protein n=1 Tax=Sphingomonas alba TaxID=2908208 RepID=A0ABT0RKT5_9SPHN|nr:DUF4163 domain-containing protein [Sphingomonas alba]MCL6683062.1 DUF4163 domain-containing protein [Sphingomonas alba]
MKYFAALALILAGCGPKASETPPNQAADNGQAATKPLPAAPPAKPFSVETKNDLIEYDFSYPAEAAAIPELVKRFAGEMEKEKSELVANAEEDKAMREKLGTDFNPFSASTAYETSGQTDRLLSLRVDSGGYTGGAHGYASTDALLWDRRARREIKFADLFAEASNRDRLLTQRWCDSLNKAREEKRGEPAGGGGMFDDYPTLDDVSIIPVDGNKDGKFEKLLVVASPYVAGPWVEGDYEVELAVSSDLVAALKNEFKPSFKA